MRRDSDQISPADAIVRNTMPAPSRFEIAYQAWHDDPVTLTNESRALAELSHSAVNAQDMIAAMLDAYHARAEILDPPIAMDRWRDGASYLIARQQRGARRMLQTGR